MSNSCDIIPQIKNKKGEWVDSLLFTSLLENLKDRELAKKAYQQVHSKEFLNWFGDWITSKKNNVNIVFKNNKELNTIGTEEEYSRYLNTIFPNSKSTDIVFHETDKDFDKFQSRFSEELGYNVPIYFTKNYKDKSVFGINFNDGGKDSSNYIAAIVNIINPAYNQGKDFIWKNKEDLDKYTKLNHEYKNKVDSINPFTSEGSKEIKELNSIYEPQILKLINISRSNDKITQARLEHNDGLVIQESNINWIAVKNPNQIHILGSKEDIKNFKNWKSNSNNQVSKVVDENGEPLVVYHRSSEQFNEFNAEESDKDSTIHDLQAKGYYFNASPNNKLYGDVLYPVFLNIKKLGKPSDVLESKPIYGKEYYDKDAGGYIADVEDYETTQNNKDYNGVADKPNKPWDSSEIIVFEPNQIKSIANTGSYSESNNIYASPESSETEELEKKLKLRNKDGSRKRLFKKNYEKTHQEVIKLNKSGKIPQGYKATRIEVKGEKGDSRMYDAIAIQPIAIASSEGKTSRVVSSVFGNKKSLSTSEVLQGITEANVPAVWKTLAKRLSGLISNDVKVEVISKEEMSKYETYDSKGNAMIAGGIYLPSENKIYIQPDQDVKVIIHEIIHALTYHKLKSDATVTKEFNKIYEYVKQHSEVFDSVNTQYAMQNLDEFMTGIFTNPEFIAKLKSIPGISSKKASVWDDIINFFSAIFEHYGFSQERGQSILEESMEAAINVIEESKSESDSMMNSYEDYSDYVEEMYASPEDVEDFKNDIHDGEVPTMSSEEVEAENEKAAKALVDIRDRLNRLEKILKNNVNNATTKDAVEKLSKLNKKLEKADALKGIQDYIKSASEIIPEYQKIMNILKSEPNNLDNIDLLTFVGRFTNIFDNLKELQQEMFRSENPKEAEAVKEYEIGLAIARNEGRDDQYIEETPKPVNTTRLLDDSVKKLEGIQRDYKEVGRNLLAQSLFSQYSEDEIAARKQLKKELLKKNPRDAYALSLATTWQELAAEMKEASRDIDSYERWLTSALGGSTNDFIALIAKKIKDNKAEVTERLRAHEERLGAAYNKYIKDSEVNPNNVDEVNAPFLEEVIYTDSEGNEFRVKEFISEFNQEAFSKDKKAFASEIEKHKGNKTLYNKKWREWLKAHTQPKDNAEEIIAAMYAEMTAFEFKQWAEKNYFDADNGKRYYKGELIEPGAIYRGSSKVNKLTAAQKEYFDVIKATQKELKLLLPKEKARSLGNMLPSVYKEGWKFGMGEGTLMGDIKDMGKFNEGDTNYELVDLSGKAHRDVPFHHTARMDASITSSDILQSLLKAAKSWETAHTNMKILSEVQLAQDLAAYGTMGVKKTNSSGEGKIDPLSSVNKVLTKEGETNLQNRLDEVIKDLFYNQEEDATEIAGISANKAVTSALKATSIISLSGAWISSTVNAAMGNLNNLVEAYAGENINIKNLKKGTAKYFAHVPVFLADRHKLEGKHWMTKLIEDYDFLHGEHINNFGENVSGSRAKKELEASNLMFLNAGAEHQIGISNGLAYLDAIKWINGEFVSRKQYAENNKDMKEYDKAKSLLDIYSENEGKLPAQYAAKWTVKDRQKVKNKVHEINKYVQGNYAREDRSALQRRWYGKLAELFRKYVVSGFARRYGKKRYNTATGSIMEGYYRSTFNFVVGLVKDMKEVGMREALNLNNPTAAQKTNMRRMVAEGVMFGIMLAIVSALTPDDDEEKNTYWENVGLLLARRMQGEISFYVNPSETWRILKSPSVAMSTVENSVDFVGGLVFKWGDDELYSRDTGIWKKGDSKDLARAVKLIPVLKGVLAGLTPEEQLKVFNR